MGPIFTSKACFSPKYSPEAQQHLSNRNSILFLLFLRAYLKSHRITDIGNDNRHLSFNLDKWHSHIKWSYQVLDYRKLTMTEVQLALEED